MDNFGVSRGAVPTGETLYLPPQLRRRPRPAAAGSRADRRARAEANEARGPGEGTLGSRRERRAETRAGGGGLCRNARTNRLPARIGFEDRRSVAKGQSADTGSERLPSYRSDEQDL